MHSSSYQLAQRAMADLKASVVQLLESSDGVGLSNAEIGRALGIYRGHEGHEGHIPRTLLQALLEEGVVVQDEETKKWMLKSIR